ncbi:hypothetical protein B0O80DRAFT_490361 [Mortierella sp. GBAus27b]|nr:hypothetical protein B0O80DRAFT_490361 [Mortierella sp. GBAus27b]
MRGFFDDDKPAETIDEMALDYIDQLEQQGERVVLLGIMDSFPTMTPLMMQIVAEEPMEDYGPEFFWKLLHKGDDADDRTTEEELVLWKKAPEIGPWVTRLRRNHSTPRYCGDVVLFRAMIQQDSRLPLVTASDWEPYVQGEIKVHDIHCKHDDMRELGPMAEIGGVLDQRLGEIHAYDMKKE